ncbi:LysR family transcriptional regulator [Streptomyces sp. CB01881]|uniref:LysR family transcriptional regulator n=1 Tax=Streptomyces sp. CB01881 TaxID=2078691 RepID=UPI000CDBE83E|nr:LysR family transcriptional regulator [Streptomyces sp. CB01881]AUY54573.1 LysR family transcriptional regulator [Streptomyces sp. CB01881]TYC72055.1 LysR family transcriptional regulator [Streptomyces sp. CB01881]
MLDVRRLQVLRAVVNGGSVSAAATALGYTPSAISQQVAVLEKETGTALLERVGRGVRPTAAGRLLAEHAAVIERRVAEAGAALADLLAGRSGSLTVRYFATAGASLVAPAVAAFRADHPGVRLDLGMTDPEDPLDEVLQGRADLAVVVQPRDQDHPGLHLVHLLDDPYRAVLGKGHPLTAKRVLDLADLAGEPWVGSERPGVCQDTVLDACATAGFRPDFAVDSEDYPTAQGFVAAGLGVALVPLLGLAARRHPGVTVRRLRAPEPVRSIHAAVRRTAWGRPALTRLVAALQATARA